MTLVELMVVALIIILVAGIAFMNGGGANIQLQRQNVAYELKNAFERARFDSVKRRAEGTAPPEAEVIIESDRYTLRTDSDITTPGLESVVRTIPSNISIARYEGGSGAVTVTFDRRGETTTTGASSPVFLVCNGTCSASDDTASNANIVFITATGTVNLLGGGLTPQSAFTAPAVTGPVQNAADLNTWTLVTPTP